MTKHRDLMALNTPEHIKWFDDLGPGNEKYRFLSNFYEGSPLTLPLFDPEKVYAWTGEAFFAAWKANDSETFLEIFTERDPRKARSLGRKCDLRPDWEQIKYDVMMLTLRLKFDLDREEGKRLLATGNAFLQEGTYWGDDVWGTKLQEKGEPGRNWLGTMLMAVRAELKAETVFGASHNTIYSTLQWLVSRKPSAFLINHPTEEFESDGRRESVWEIIKRELPEAQ